MTPNDGKVHCIPPKDELFPVIVPHFEMKLSVWLAVTPSASKREEAEKVRICVYGKETHRKIKVAMQWQVTHMKHTHTHLFAFHFIRT